MQQTIRFLTLAVLAAVCSPDLSARMKSSDYFPAGLQRSLADAGENGDSKEIDRLLAKGADINAEGKEKMTALMWTLIHQNRKGFEHLLQKGANPNVPMEESTLTSDGLTDGSSVTSLSARVVDSWYLEMALKYGGNPNIVNPVRKTTPIFECITLSDRRRPQEAQARITQVRMLIAAGANLAVRDKDGFALLFLAHAAIRYDLIHEFLQAGVDPTAPLSPRGTTLAELVPQARIDRKSELYQWRANVIGLLRARGIEVRDPK